MTRSVFPPSRGHRPQEAQLLPISPRRPRLAAVLAGGLALVVAACGSGTGSPSTSASPSAPSEPVKLVVGLGYIPNVQFAQFYYADQQGYYEAAGLDVELQNKIDPDLITLIGQGAIDIGSADGTSVIPAVSQGIPLTYAATIYGQFPSIVYAKASSGITKAADLKGKEIGIPGKFGSSWVMLQALLKSANLTENDVKITPYPDFGQGVALQQGAIDAATGFANNEPVQLELTGEDAVVLTVDDFVALPGPGLVTGASLATKREALKAFVAATLRAMDEIAADPEKGMEAAIAAVPDIAKAREAQRAVLDATIAAWKNPRVSGPYGTIDTAGWDASITFMTDLGLVPNPVTTDKLVTSDLLP